MDRKKRKPGGTRVGNALRWLTKQGKTIAPEILDAAGKITGIKTLENIGDLIEGDPILSEEDKDLLMMELEADIREQESITRRWETDMNSDNRLSKNIRPVILITLTSMLAIFMFLDSAELLQVDEMWVDLLSSLLIITFGGYYGARTVEKVMNRK